MPFSDTSLTSLFLQSSIADSEADYNRSLANPAFPHWDAIVLTASDASQASGYQKQLDFRKEAGRLPQNTDFIIVPDEGNKRIGSAGSTLSVLCTLKKKYGSFFGKKILCIHAGGNSSRCPQYSALGKLFAPLPTTIGGVPAALFDMFLLSMASIPARMKEGMLLLSGDVTLLFNPLMCDFGHAEAAVISFKEDVETGKDHGVYIKNAVTGNVKRFLHKQTVDTLKKEGAVDEHNRCAIDTGAIWLCPEILDKLYGLVDTEEKYKSIVNETVRLSLYHDIAYCLAEDSTEESFMRETPEGHFCPELEEARKKLWNAIGSYSMKLMIIAPAKFVHFGSVPDILTLLFSGIRDYESIGWKKQICSSIARDDVAGYNAVLSSDASVGTGSYLEVSYVHSGAEIGCNTYISFLDIPGGITIPDDVLLHGLKQKNGKFVCRIMGTHDNPKQGKLFGMDLSVVSEKTGIKTASTLWESDLYLECDTMKEAIESALLLYRIVTENAPRTEAWDKADKKSLRAGFCDADAQAIIDWNAHMADLVQMDDLAKNIQKGVSARETAFGRNRLSPIQEYWLKEQEKKWDLSQMADLSFAVRLYYYLGVALKEDTYTAKCFRTIANSVLCATETHLHYNNSCRIVKSEVCVKLPLRVNFGGGWSDTCPYCIENGGTVLNAAVKLNGDFPVEVRIVRIPDEKIVFDSRDMDVHGVFDTIEPLQATGDPFDPFALQKACLLACGIIPKTGGNLGDILHRLGGGFEMHSEVTNVPKGSGLGTSSILAAAAAKAVFELVGVNCPDESLYETVLAMEQIMSTGGGWQDQVGGAVPGFKYITSVPGIEQKLKIEQICIPEKAKKELSDRFAIIYTGQRRLARHLLRDVVGRYVGNEPESLFAHEEIRKVAFSMRKALENGDIDTFAGLLDYHWTLSQKIDKGSTNTLINQVFLSIEDLIDAKMCCGAGGGGFLQVILKKGVTKADVHKRLKEVFQDFAVDVWDSEFVF